MYKEWHDILFPKPVEVVLPPPVYSITSMYGGWLVTQEGRVMSDSPVFMDEAEAKFRADLLNNRHKYGMSRRRRRRY